MIFGRFGSAFLLVAIWCCSVLVECQVNPVAPITNFRRGHNGRVEYIRANISPQHLYKGTDASNGARAYVAAMGSEYDDAGHLIAKRLGGTGDETYNIIPQNWRINRGGFRTGVEKPVADDVAKGNTVIYEIWPRYRLPTDTRPNVLVFGAKRTDGQIVLPRSVIENPPSPPTRQKQKSQKRQRAWA